MSRPTKQRSIIVNDSAQDSHRSGQKQYGTRMTGATSKYSNLNGEFQTTHFTHKTASRTASRLGID